jgi:hypothetical protein
MPVLANKLGSFLVGLLRSPGPVLLLFFQSGKKKRIYNYYCSAKLNKPSIVPNVQHIIHFRVVAVFLLTFNYSTAALY